MDKRKKSSPINGKLGGHPKIFNEDKRNFAKKLYLEGAPVSEIAEHTGISIQHLYRLKNEWKIKQLKVGLVTIENFEQGMSLSDCYDLEVLKAVCKLKSMAPRIYRKSFGELLNAAASGQVDLAMCNFSPIEERKRTNQFSSSYSVSVRGDIAFFVKKQSTFYHVNQIYKGRFGVLKHSLHDHFLNEKRVLKVKKFLKDEDMFKELFADSIDCVLCDKGGIKKEFLVNLREAPSPWELNYGLRPSIAYHLKEDRLASEIDDSIEKMRSFGLFDLFLEKAKSGVQNSKKIDAEVERSLEHIKKL